MREIYEIDEDVQGENEDSFKTYTETKDINKATYKHICYHDEPNNKGECRPCKRIKLK